MFNPIIANAVLYWEIEKLRNKEKEQAKLINTLFIYQLLLKKIIDLIRSWGGAMKYVMNKMKIVKSEILKMYIYFEMTLNFMID